MLGLLQGPFVKLWTNPFLIQVIAINSADLLRMETTFLSQIRAELFQIEAAMTNRGIFISNWCTTDIKEPHEPRKEKNTHLF